MLLLQNPEDQPEYPIVEKKYFVEFMYLQDRSSKADVITIEADKGNNSPPPNSEPFPQSEAERTVVEVTSYFFSASQIWAMWPVFLEKASLNVLCVNFTSLFDQSQIVQSVEHPIREWWTQYEILI